MLFQNWQVDMKKYHFYVTPCFASGYMVCERGRGNHFCVAYPTKYRAQIVARTLCRCAVASLG